MKPSISRETIIDRRQPAMRWSAVFAGAAVAVGLWVLLQTLGMGVGLAAIDTDDAGSLRGAGIGTSVWSLLAPLIAMFGGGLFAGWLASTRDPKVAGMHGVVVWAFTAVLGVMTTLWIVMALAAGAAKVGGAAANAGGAVLEKGIGMAGNVDAREGLADLGVDADDLLAPVNNKLREQGKPTVTSHQLMDATRGVVHHGLREGHFDRDLFVRQLAARTALSRSDAEDVVNQLGDKWDRAMTRLGTAGKEATHAALSAADATGKALLWAGLSLLLGLGTAIAGSVLALGMRDGGPRRKRHDTAQTPVVPPPPVNPPVNPTDVPTVIG
jgi:hypothetical protein